ncbi:MAG: ImmA/IrrE family metallo-endopeptidase [Bifidobacteriaceae bacterium]|jgi:Zn-dependent peptidase ImmA (M78 family)|nr:ImmA/IrrE family metallo-endopeptidase [Bifidobacteriaceae bacterium]
MVTRLRVEPALLAWAAARAGKDEETLTAKFKHYPQWQTGEYDPTFGQLEDFADYTRTPLGYLFLTEPPEENLPLPDFRTLGNATLERPSPDLLDTIYSCQQRQGWYHDYAQSEGLETLGFVGSVQVTDSPITVAGTIREAISFGLGQRAKCHTSGDVRRYLINAIETLGVLVMVNGVVSNNTRRKLNPQEFRGFAIADSLAPLIFINGADAKAAQLFTLIHELAHIFAGESALSDADMSANSGQDKELWANKVAAEVLVPRAELRAVWPGDCNSGELERVAHHFKVSTLVVLKSAFDSGLIGWGDYRSRYTAEREHARQHLDERGSAGGGNFYNTQPVRVSRRFASAVVSWTLEGKTLFSDAYALLDVAKHETFERLAEVVTT